MVCKSIQQFVVQVPWLSLQDSENKLCTPGKKLFDNLGKKVDKFMYFFPGVKKLQVHDYCYYQVVNKPSQYNTVSCAPTPFLFFWATVSYNEVGLQFSVWLRMTLHFWLLGQHLLDTQITVCSNMRGHHATVATVLCSVGEWNQGFMLANQALCWLSYIPTLSCMYFCPPHRTLKSL